MPRDRSKFAAAAASRVIGVTRHSLKLLERTPLLDELGDGYDADKVEDLREQRRRVLPPWEAGQPLALAVPCTAAEWSCTLDLTPDNDRDVAEDFLSAHSRTLAPGEELTGWWSISDEMLERLVNDGGIILGVTGGFVHQVAQVIDRAGEIPWRNRRALVIRHLHGSAAQPYLGFVEGMTPTGCYRTALDL